MTLIYAGALLLFVFVLAAAAAGADVGVSVVVVVVVVAAVVAVALPVAAAAAAADAAESTRYGARIYFIIHYFLADNTVEINEAHCRNSGRDAYPVGARAFLSS